VRPPRSIRRHAAGDRRVTARDYGCANGRAAGHGAVRGAGRRRSPSGPDIARFLRGRRAGAATRSAAHWGAHAPRAPPSLESGHRFAGVQSLHEITRGVAQFGFQGRRARFARKNDDVGQGSERAVEEATNQTFGSASPLSTSATSRVEKAFPGSRSSGVGSCVLPSITPDEVKTAVAHGMDGDDQTAVRLLSAPQGKGSFWCGTSPTLANISGRTSADRRGGGPPRR